MTAPGMPAVNISACKPLQGASVDPKGLSCKLASQHVDDARHAKSQADRLVVCLQAILRSLIWAWRRASTSSCAARWTPSCTMARW